MMTGRLALCVAGFMLARAAVALEGREAALEDLPEAVRKTVVEQSKDRVLRRIAVEEDGGTRIYEAAFVIAGRKVDMMIDAAGTAIAIEERIDLSETPLAVSARIKKSAGSGKVTSVESISTGGVVTAYEAEVLSAGKRFEIYVSPAGRLIPAVISSMRAVARHRAGEK